uniref:Uncharacterized protein n=1 Tax=Parascaris univalens TaxID=6257 RepID=A0A915C779_PARUN
MGKAVDASTSKAQQLRNVDHLLNRNRRRKTKDIAATSVSRDLVTGSFTDSGVRTKAEKPGVKDIPEAAKPVRDDCTVDSVKLMAIKEILAETKRAALRAELIGSQGWKKPTCLSINKKFLKRTLEASLSCRKNTPR